MLDFLKKIKNLILILLWCAMTAALVAGIGLNAVYSANGTLSDGEVYLRLWFALACYGMMGLPYIVEFFSRMRLPFSLEFLLPLYSFSEIGAIVFGLYEIFPAWDKIMATAGGMILAAVGFSVAELMLRENAAGKKKIAVATAIALLFALGASFFKTLIRLCLGLLPQIPLGGADTLYYMSCLFGGAAIFVLTALFSFLEKEQRLSAFAAKKTERAKRREN